MAEGRVSGVTSRDLRGPRLEPLRSRLVIEGEPNARPRRRRGSRARRLGALAAVSFLAAPGTALGAVVVGGPAPVTYMNPQVTIDPGESLDFLNLDATAPHDVTSVDVGANAEALFRSETVGFGVMVPVVGAESLGPGSYDFICSIHSFMEGTLTVRGEGGGGGDSKAPRLSVRVLDRELEDVLDRGALRVRLKVNEAARVRLSATAGRREVKIASGRSKLKSGVTKTKLKLSGSGRRVLKQADRLRIAVEGKATDAAGNSRKQSARATLK